MRSYTEAGLAAPLLKATTELGYESMTPIQEAAIPVVLGGRDVMGAAQTGTGKTAAFALPLLQRMLKHQSLSTSPARHPVRALVLLPTRELAAQVATAITRYAKYTDLRTAVVFGGMDMKPQTLELRAGVEILVATPGRLLDHLEAKNCSLQQVEYVVLDEADRMLDIGFLPDLERILAFLPSRRVTLLFSATFSNDIKRLAASYLTDPALIEVARPNATAATVEQLFYEVSMQDKQRLLAALMRDKDVGQAFVFCNSKLGCSRLARALEKQGFATSALHGDKSQDERLKSLDAFKQGQVQLLVATDVAARGLDIKDVPAVFNYDLPFNAEDYVHRIGRTGRAGASGLAMSFITESDARLLGDIEKLIKQKIEISPLPSVTFEVSQDRTPRGAERHQRSERQSGKSGFLGRESGAGVARGAVRESPKVKLDPIFTEAYEEKPAQEQVPSWEPASAKNAGSKASGNIKSKSKRKLPALFKSEE